MASPKDKGTSQPNSPGSKQSEDNKENAPIILQPKTYTASAPVKPLDLSSIPTIPNVFSMDPDSPTKSDMTPEYVAWNSKTALGKVRYETPEFHGLLLVEVTVTVEDDSENQTKFATPKKVAYEKKTRVIEEVDADQENKDSPGKLAKGSPGKLSSPRTPKRPALQERVNEATPKETTTPKETPLKEVRSSRLARQALQNYINKALGEGVAKKAAFHKNRLDMDSLDQHEEIRSKSPSDAKVVHVVIVPVNNQEEAKEFDEKLAGLQDQPILVNNDHFGKGKKNVKTTYCSILQTQLVHATDKGKAYSKYMSVLFWNAVRRLEPNQLVHDGVVVETLKGHLESPHTIGLRAKVDSWGLSSMTLSFDLVSIYGSEVNALQLAKSQTVGNDSIGSYKAVRESLRGLQVRFNQEKGSPKKGLIKGSEDRTYSDRVAIIRDVKLSKEVGPIPFASEEKPISMKQYLVKYNIPFNDDMNQLLLADIGHYKPYWVALDFLYILPGQPIRNSGHLNQKLRAVREDIQVRHGFTPFLALHGNAFMRKVNNVDMDKFFFANEGNVEVTPYVAPAVVHSSALEKTFVAETLLEPCSIGVIYASQDTNAPTTANIKERMLNALKKQQHILPFSLEIVTERVTSVQELVRVQKYNVTSWIGSFKECDVLIGVIDQSSFDTTRYQEIESEMHRLGERSIGAVTACTKLSSVTSVFQPPIDKVTFPTSILRKISVMRGANVLQDLPIEGHVKTSFAGGLIVVGAHITHSATHSTENSPSVSALVVSRDNARPTYFLATSHIETSADPTRKTDVKKDAPLTKAKRHEISQLGDRLTEQFKTWKADSDPDLKHPRVVFYRWGRYIPQKHPQAAKLKEGFMEEHEHEIKQISDAYQHVFGPEKKPPLTYITVSGNTRRDNNDPSIFTLRDDGRGVSSLTSDPSEKYQYEIISDAPEVGALGAEKLRDLVSYNPKILRMGNNTS